MRATIGFTLLELLVVIAIAAVVAAITLPASRTIIEQNHVMTCSANLQRLGVALKAYYLDYEGVPPVLIPEDGSDTATPYEEMFDPATEPEGYPVVSGGPWEPNPLMVLYRGGYLRHRRNLHCPRDRDHADAADPAYFQSYVGRQDIDPATTDPEEQKKLVKIQFQGEDILINRYKYMPCRMWRLPNDPPPGPHHAGR